MNKRILALMSGIFLMLSIFCSCNNDIELTEAEYDNKIDTINKERENFENQDQGETKAYLVGRGWDVDP